MCKISSGKNIYEELLELLKTGKNCAFATVTGRKYSAPQKAGNSAIFCTNGLVAGTIGGGITEHKTQHIAVQAIDKKESVHFTFEQESVKTDPAVTDCGEGVTVLIDANPHAHAGVFEQLISSGINRIPGVLLTSFDPANHLLERSWITKQNLEGERGRLSSELVQKITGMLDLPEENASLAIQLAENEGKRIIFLQTIMPRPHLIIAGAGHVGQALSHFGALLDFDVTVWDKRKEYATPLNLPDATTILNGEQEELPEKIQIDKNTYLVIVTNDHDMDAAVLKTFIKSPAAYIGMIGSRKKISQIQKMFFAEKWATQEEWDKIFAPIGLKINSKTVQEIAVSIAAQLVLVRNQKKEQKIMVEKQNSVTSDAVQ